MGDLASDPSIFIRSMATRGQVGGIARATEDVVRILDASSMNYVIVETVGAGQSDVDVKSIANTTIVVTAPGLGDEIQALKAGIMEIGDIFVVNKADTGDADLSVREIYSTLTMAEPVNGWRPRVLKSSALSGEGIDTLVEAIEQHAKHMRSSGEQARLSELRLRRDFLEAARRYFEDIVLEELASTPRFRKLLDEVERGKVDPFTAARRLLERS
jgi:LAO/AO transport system kinase